jgi:LuxR family transcriptional regulator, maltose regulon positive regulatory protein
MATGWRSSTTEFSRAAKCGLYGAQASAPVPEAALNEAKSDELVTLFVESAPYVLEILVLVAKMHPGDEYISRILTLCREYMQILQNGSYHPTPLSQREIDLLALMAEGLSSKGITARLYISEETAKWYFRTIYQKLESSGKVAAVKVSQTRGYPAV